MSMLWTRRVGKESVILYRKTEVPKATHHINLIKLQEGDDYHYVYVKDYDKLGE